MSTQSSPSFYQPPPQPQPPAQASSSRSIDLRIPVNDNVSLEAILVLPATKDDMSSSEHSNSVAILSHPWSWLGGSMHDHVLHNLSTAFLNLDYHVILFNTRGVGESSGRASFTGVAESQDLQSVLAWAVEEIDNLNTAVLIGYSYGSLITSMVPSPKRLHPGKINRAAHILISHPLGPMASFLTFFNIAKYTSAFDQVLTDPDLDVLLIYGNNDQFFSSKRYEAWIARCRGIRGQALEKLGSLLGQEIILPGMPAIGTLSSGSNLSSSVGRAESVDEGARPKDPLKLDVKMIERGDHFWRGSSGKYLRNAVSDWVERL